MRIKIVPSKYSMCQRTNYQLSTANFGRKTIDNSYVFIVNCYDFIVNLL